MYDTRWSMDLLSVARLNQPSLRILRNSIYALHGYTFSDPELLSHFSGYDWYEPRSRNIEDQLTITDRSNIRMIQAFERMSESGETVRWGEEAVGVWQASPYMAAGWGDRFVFYADGTFEFLRSQMSQFQMVHGLEGTYSIRGNVVTLSVERIIFYEHESTYAFNDLDGWQWNVSDLNSATFERPIPLRLPVGPIGTSTEFNRIEAMIGGVSFYRLASDPTDRY